MGYLRKGQEGETWIVSGTLGIGTWALAGLMIVMPMGRERAAPFISNFKLISPGLLLRSNIDND